MANQVSSSDESDIEPRLKVTEEEKDYGTIPGSVEATAAARYMTPAQANPVVGRAKRKKVKKYKEKKQENKTQTNRYTITIYLSTLK